MTDVADGRLRADGDLSIADFAILGWAWRHQHHKVELSDFPQVERWYKALMARPATKRGTEAKLDGVLPRRRFYTKRKN